MEQAHPRIQISHYDELSATGLHKREEGLVQALLSESWLMHKLGRRGWGEVDVEENNVANGYGHVLVLIGRRQVLACQCCAM